MGEVQGECECEGEGEGEGEGCGVTWLGLGLGHVAAHRGHSRIEHALESTHVQPRGQREVRRVAAERGVLCGGRGECAASSKVVEAVLGALLVVDQVTACNLLVDQAEAET